MTYYIKTDDEKYLIELDIKGKNILISKLDCIQNEDYPTYSGIFESELDEAQNYEGYTLKDLYDENQILLETIANLQTQIEDIRGKE
tara:strand:+ start:1014 stop:1274 length:261 start_codon:yes stop_codon:yes gene_type:complete